jgi:hypothetical protein
LAAASDGCWRVSFDVGIVCVMTLRASMPHLSVSLFIAPLEIVQDRRRAAGPVRPARPRTGLAYDFKSPQPEHERSPFGLAVSPPSAQNVGVYYPWVQNVGVYYPWASIIPAIGTERGCLLSLRTWVSIIASGSPSRRHRHRTRVSIIPTEKRRKVDNRDSLASTRKVSLCDPPPFVYCRTWQALGGLSAATSWRKRYSRQRFVDRLPALSRSPCV